MTPQTDNLAAEVEYLCLVNPGADTEGAIPMAQRAYWPCAAGAVIARVGAATAEMLAGRRPLALLKTALRLGPNATWDDTRTAIIAKIAGHVCSRDGGISVQDELDLHDDVDVTGGAIDFPGPITIRKNVLDSVRLAATGSIHVDGSIEAADVRTSADLSVNRGICGKERGRVHAVGCVKARFASNAYIEAGADVHIENEVANSHIIAGGCFSAVSGDVLSSHITACREIRCHSVGSEARIRATLELSLHPDEIKQFHDSLRRVQVLTNAAASARTTIEPLLRNMKHLNAQQREKATDLMYQADEADKQAKELLAALGTPRKKLSTAMAAMIHISGTLHTETVLRCLGYEAVVRETIRGPLKILLRGGKSDPHFALLNAAGKDVKIIAASAASDAAWKHIQPAILG